jgi:ribosomal-protein-alanine N-acetyltransferase
MKQFMTKKNPLLQPLPLFAIISSTLLMIGTGIITLTNLPKASSAQVVTKKRYECENCGARVVFNNAAENKPDPTKNNSTNFNTVIVKVTNGRYRHVIETDRLLLREVTMNDLDEVNKIYTNPENERSSVWKLHSDKEKTKEKINDMINNYRTGKPEHWIVCDKKTNKIVAIGGMFSYLAANKRISMGWTVDSNSWGNGYAVELGKACIEYAMKFLNINRVEATVRINNIASRKVLEKIGLSYSTHFRNNWRLKDEVLSHYQFVILRKDIEEQLKKSKV